MPTYDYRCEANGKTVEVNHSMQTSLATWGDVCHASGQTLGDTDADAPVHRLANGGQVIRRGSLGETTPACGAPRCCGGGCG